MTTNRIVSALIIIVIVIGSFGCSKHDEDVKEALTRKLNSDINPDSIASYISWLQSMGTRFALAPHHRDVAIKIRNKFRNIGYQNSDLDSFLVNRTLTINGTVTTYTGWQYNVIATLAGNNTDSVSVIGAHYDDMNGHGDPYTLAPGANDNASGIAAVLEIARVMKRNGYTPAYTIEFVAFGAEELGLLGSYDYANKAIVSMKPVRFMLNNDMIAIEAHSDGWKVNILDYDNSHFIREKAETLAGRYSLLTAYNDNTYNKSSDSYAFFSKRYKALFFFSDDEDGYYHSSSDLASRLNFRYCSEIARLNCSVLVNYN